MKIDSVFLFGSMPVNLSSIHFNDIWIDIFKLHLSVGPIECVDFQQIHVYTKQIKGVFVTSLGLWSSHLFRPYYFFNIPCCMALVGQFSANIIHNKAAWFETLTSSQKNTHFPTCGDNVVEYLLSTMANYKFGYGKDSGRTHILEMKCYFSADASGWTRLHTLWFDLAAISFIQPDPRLGIANEWVD